MCLGLVVASSGSSGWSARPSPSSPPPAELECQRCGKRHGDTREAGTDRGIEPDHYRRGREEWPGPGPGRSHRSSQRAASGDQSAFNELVDRFAPLVWRIARYYRLSAADAGDVSQTTWLRLVEALDRIREPERLGAWLVTTAKREALATIRRRYRLVPDADLSAVEPETPGRVPSVAADGHRRARDRRDPGGGARGLGDAAGALPRAPRPPPRRSARPVRGDRRQPGRCRSGASARPASAASADCGATRRWRVSPRPVGATHHRVERSAGERHRRRQRRCLILSSTPSRRSWPLPCAKTRSRRASWRERVPHGPGASSMPSWPSCWPRRRRSCARRRRSVRSRSCRAASSSMSSEWRGAGGAASSSAS